MACPDQSGRGSACKSCHGTRWCRFRLAAGLPSLTAGSHDSPADGIVGRLGPTVGQALHDYCCPESDCDGARCTGAASVRFPEVRLELFLPVWLSHLARACAELGEFNEAWSYIGEAMTTIETTKEKWSEAEVNRMAGEIALISPDQPKPI